MKTNWIEDLWVNSPMRVHTQRHEMHYFRRLRPLDPGGAVLEIGCGRGMGARLICREFMPRKLDAVDINPNMIRRARRRQEARTACNIQFEIGDAQELPFADESMDAVFNFGIIHHLENWRRGIAEVARVIRVGGIFYFEELFPPFYANFVTRHFLEHPLTNRFDGPQYRSALELAGLSLLPGYRESRFQILGVCERVR